MSQMIAALFESRARAEEALAALIGTGLARDRLHIIGGGEGGDAATMSSAEEIAAGAGDPAELSGLGLPEEDASAFAAGLSGGGAVLAVRVDEAEIDETIRVVDTFEPIDLDARTEERRESGSGGPAGADAGGALGAGLSAGGMGSQTNTGAVPGMGAMTEGTNAVGSGDLRTGEASLSDGGGSSTTATGARRGDERAGAPGALELGAPPDAQLATKQAPGAEQTAGLGLDAKPDLFRRETSRVGRVRAYAKD
jgi:hypothetical protein